MRRSKIGAAVAFALASIAAQALAAPVREVAADTVVSWSPKTDADPQVYRVGDLSITLASEKAGRSGPPILTVSAPRIGRTSLAANQDVVFPPGAAFFVSPLDPQADGPAVVLETWSGGAHCCLRVTFLDPVGGRWRTVNGGAWDSDPGRLPTDLDGDGVPDFVFEDDDFLYAFDCTTCSLPPPKIFDLIDGEWRDVSKNPKYGKLFAAQMATTRAQCETSAREQRNAACAAYVADAARIGRFDEAWAVMLQHYDRTDQWASPAGCNVAWKDHACPKGQEIEFNTYPDALRNFLQEGGYIPKG